MMKPHTPREHWKQFRSVQVPADSSGAGSLMATGGSALMQIPNPWTEGIGAGLMVGGGIVDMIQARREAAREARARRENEAAAVMDERARAESSARLEEAGKMNIIPMDRHMTAHSLATGGTVPRFPEGGEEEREENRPNVEYIPQGSGTSIMPDKDYGDPYDIGHFANSGLSHGDPSKRSHGWNYSIEGNVAENKYQPSGLEYITRNRFLSPLLGLAGRIAPLAIGARYPLIGNYLGTLSSLYHGSPLGLAMNAIPAVTGTIASGYRPWSIKGPYDSLKSYWEGKTDINPLSQVGRKNLLNNALWLAPTIASWTSGPKYKMPTIGSNAFY